MPNHVHAVIHLIGSWTLERVMHTHKSYTGLAINRTLGRSGTLWQEESFDRYIRDERHFRRSIRYILENPVKARLTNSLDGWPWVYVREEVDPRQKG